MLDFIAGGFELVASYSIGNRKRYGFLVGIVCDILWIQIGLMAKLYGLVSIASLALVVNVRNFLRWRKESR